MSDLSSLLKKKPLQSPAKRLVGNVPPSISVRHAPDVIRNPPGMPGGGPGVPGGGYTPSSVAAISDSRTQQYGGRPGSPSTLQEAMQIEKGPDAEGGMDPMSDWFTRGHMPASIYTADAPNPSGQPTARHPGMYGGGHMPSSIQQATDPSLSQYGGNRVGGHMPSSIQKAEGPPAQQYKGNGIGGHMPGSISQVSAPSPGSAYQGNGMGGNMPRSIAQASAPQVAGQRMPATAAPEMGPNAQPPMPNRPVGNVGMPGSVSQIGGSVSQNAAPVSPSGTFVTAPDIGVPPAPGPRQVPATLQEALAPPVTAATTQPQAPSTPMNWGTLAQALGVLPGGSAIGQMITPEMARSVGGAVMREVNQPLNNYRGDIGGYDAARAEGLSPELARGQVMGNASLRGDMDASGMPGPMARALDANRAITNIQAEERSRNRSIRDPKTMAGNRTGIAPINVAIEEQRQADEAAQMEGIRQNNAKFYDDRYARALRNPVEGVVPTQADIALADRLRAQGRDISPEAIAQYNAQDAMARAATMEHNSKLPGYDSQGRSPLVQRASARRAEQRSAMEDRQDQAANMRFEDAAFRRFGISTNPDFALQRMMQANPEAAAGLIQSQAANDMRLQQIMAQSQPDILRAQAQQLQAQAELDRNRQMAEQAAYVRSPEGVRNGLFLQHGADAPAIIQAMEGQQAQPQAGITPEAMQQAQANRDLSGPELLDTYEAVLRNSTNPNFDMNSLGMQGVTPDILQKIVDYKPWLPFDPRRGVLSPLTSWFQESQADLQRRTQLQQAAAELLKRMQPAPAGPPPVQ